MRCQTVTEKLSFFVHHELDEHTHGRIAQHLESCAPCQQALVEYQRLAEIARKMAPAALSEQALQKAKKELLAHATKQAAFGPAWFGVRPTWHHVPRFAVPLAAAALLVVAAWLWMSEDSTQMNQQRSLESFLAHGDYYALYRAMQNPIEQQRLLNDSISPEVLIETLNRYEQIKMKYGRLRTASASLVPSFFPDKLPKWKHLAKAVNINNLPPAFLKRAKQTARRMQKEQRKITPKAIIKRLSNSHLLFHR